jgi:hypothetical protein
MFFDAQRRFANGEFSYKRSLLAQYGNNGKPFRVTQPPKGFDAQAALEFRRQERAEFERLKQQYSELQDKSERLAKIFLEQQQRHATSRPERDDGDAGRNVVLLPTSSASDDDNATRTQAT